jgi:processive 1,2-diacylglycerol beta-glucosyltransferase
MSTKLLIVFASAGAGHKRAALALRSAFEAAGHSGVAEVTDVLDHMSPLFRFLYLKSYFFIIRALPWFWRYLYGRWDRSEPGGPVRRLTGALDRFHARRFIRWVREQQPTHIICTHFLAAEILAWMRLNGRLEASVAVVITDYDAHRVWIQPGVDRYFVASDKLRDLLVAKGAPSGRTVTAGIPIAPVFSEPKGREQARTELGLALDVPVVLTLGGGGGIGGMRQNVAALAASERTGAAGLQILAVAGHNAELKEQLDAMELPGHVRLVTYGFTDRIQTLMAASDMVVTKPGGMSSSECLAMGLPMVLTEPIPGQEECNAAFLVGCGAAVTARTSEEVCRAVDTLLTDADRLERMRSDALRAARPQAAADILRATLAP